MASYKNWQGNKKWQVKGVHAGVTSIVKGDKLTFGGDGESPGPDDLERKHGRTRSPWGSNCQYHNPPPGQFDYVTLQSGGRDFVIVRDTRAAPVALWCFTGLVPPANLPPRRREMGTPTVACWTAQDQRTNSEPDGTSLAGTP